MHARLRPIGGRSGPGFSLYHDKECESQLTIAHAHGPDRALGLCTNPRSPGSNPASKQKVVYVRRPGRRRGTYALLDEDMFWECGTARVSMDCCVRAQTALAARPRSARLLTQPRVLLLERLCQSLRRVPYKGACSTQRQSAMLHTATKLFLAKVSSMRSVYLRVCGLCGQCGVRAPSLSACVSPPPHHHQPFLHDTQWLELRRLPPNSAPVRPILGSYCFSNVRRSNIHDISPQKKNSIRQQAGTVMNQMSQHESVAPK